MEEKVYPYLGKCTINDKMYIVLFSEPEHGTIVLSEFKDNPALAFGKIGNFDESLFETLGTDVCVRINN